MTNGDRIRQMSNEEITLEEYKLTKREIEWADKKEITRDDYVLTNINFFFSLIKFAIRLVDCKEYIVECRKENSKKIYYIEVPIKEKPFLKEIPLDEEVTKIFLREVREYEREGI